MRPLAAAALMLSISIAHADSNQDAFNAGANFGKGNASQATGNLSNPAAVTNSIPGYTNSPPQSGYYGGVRGDDGGISSKGLLEFNNSDVGKAITDSSIKNPAVIINSEADFIKKGKEVESSSDNIVAGTDRRCQLSEISKSEFKNFSCDKDTASVETCSRTAQVDFTLEEITEEKTISLTNKDFVFRHDGGLGIYIDFKIPFSGVIENGTLSLSTSMAQGGVVFTFDVFGHRIETDSTRWTESLSGASGRTLLSGDNTFVMYGRGRSGVWNNFQIRRVGERVGDFSSGRITMKLNLTVRSKVEFFKPEIKFKESCNFNKEKGRLISSVCVEPDETRTISVDGVDREVNSDCWLYQDNYLVPESSNGTCSIYMSDPNCVVVDTSCTEETEGQCTHQAVSYQCQKTYMSQGLVCGGDYFCQSGDCANAGGAGDSGFDIAVAKLAGLASAAEDVKNEQDSINVKAFTGEVMSCRKAMAGFSNCCKDSGWGQGVGLSQCNSNEMALGKAKAKKVTVSVGEKCDRKVLGACVQKSQVYCVFGGKLSRIIQEQGRRDQLHISFGSGGSPDCRGITVPELQGINFDKLNFSDFYEDLMANQTVPNTDVMVKQVKDRIAAQVQQSGANK
ncbi:type-F conjugative transfer system mating-pair stabilization protein TraN [Pectobacterium brasiliense]|uniref:type-F conjugative transfer system mating-pair stabilization protein TraN n=1 Tax=Pectobacterium brasiliense TaxID=180957 RepID=UPI001968FAE1|nr:type-F conjugative transfer system mating-pair stabilization protein TraN [Pectobacterium brasiliense]MBN3262952.1 type-F conjugative transfer system mating-pair stabilization protein TraN [Pectobacterium brasiliense]